MDEHVPTSIHGYYPTQQRYEVPPTLSTNDTNNDTRHVVDQPKVWGPYYLGIYDLADVRESGALFCRKVSHVVDENLYHVLPVNHHHDIPPIRWPRHGVAVSDVPDWDKERSRLWQSAMELREEQKKEWELQDEPGVDFVNKNNQDEEESQQEIVEDTAAFDL
jgi:hypothetical protein